MVTNVFCTVDIYNVDSITINNKKYHFIISKKKGAKNHG